jgi:hypothetical protein
MPRSISTENYPEPSMLAATCALAQSICSNKTELPEKFGPEELTKTQNESLAFS